MDGFIDFVISINKIAVVAFVAVLGFLIFEIKKIVNEKKKKEKPVVPQFNDAVVPPPAMSVNSTPLPQFPTSKKIEKQGSPLLLIVIGVIALVGLIVIGTIIYRTSTKKKQVESTPVPIVREIQSAGLKIYDSAWGEVDSTKNEKAQPGEKLYIGIQTIVEADIDRARIKINADNWEISDITTLFNPQYKVYYREYIVATGTAQLKIDAQLHSASDGWLGD